MHDSRPVLSVRDAVVNYGRGNVVEGVSLDVFPGEIFGLIGLNGIGKTSIIKAISDLRPLSGGSVSILGHTPDSGRARQAMAYLPERFDPPWFLNGLEFLAFSASLYGKRFARTAIDAAADALALDREALSRRVQTYSKGMRQKLGLMAAILTECPLLVLDEPMSGLDPMARAHVKNMLIARRMAGGCVFFSSHILADMSEMCDRVAILHDRKIVYCGTPAGLVAQAGTPSLETAFLSVIGAERKAA